MSKMKTQTYDGDWLTALLYDLMRDCVPTGEIERIVRDFESNNQRQSIKYSNGYLAKYAKHCADRIRNATNEQYKHVTDNTINHSFSKE